MIEKTIRDFLITKTTIPVFVEDFPVNAPAGQFVLIKRTASKHKDKVDSATICIHAYGATSDRTSYNTAVLNEDVKGWMLNSFISHPSVSKLSLTTDYRNVDLTEDRQRYTAFFEVTIF